MLLRDGDTIRKKFKQLARRIEEGSEQTGRHPYVTIDTETEGREPFDKKDALIWGRGAIKMWSLCWQGYAYSIPTNLQRPHYPSVAEGLDAFEEILLPIVDRVVMHNANYDLQVFYNEGLNLYDGPLDRIYCTMIGGWVADTSRPKSLKDRSVFIGRYLNATRTIDFTNDKELAHYAEQDVVATDELYQLQQWGDIVTKRKDIPYNMENCARERLTRINTPFKAQMFLAYEHAILRSVFDCQRTGMLFDSKALAEARSKAIAAIEDVEGKIFQQLGEVINLNSPKQLGPVLEAKTGVTLPRTAKGQPSTAEKVLFLNKDAHPIFDQLIQAKKWTKQVGTFIGKEKGTALERFINPDTNAIHCTLSSIGAQTGRSSASNPNLQQQPSRTDVFGIRKCYVARPKRSIICLDYAQLELRVMCLFAKDERMGDVLRDPKGDLHQTTAEEFQVDRSPTAKQLNFLLLYGGGPYMLSQKLTEEGVPTDESTARAYGDIYDRTYARIREQRLKWVEQYLADGYCEYWIGRKRELEEEVDPSKRQSMHRAETKLANNIVQGSGQDFLKAAIIRCTRNVSWDKRILNSIQFGNSKLEREHKAALQDNHRKWQKYRKMLKKAHSKWLLQVHDEVLFECDKSAAHEAGAAVADMMTWRHFFPSRYEYDIPLVTEGGIASNWKEAKLAEKGFGEYSVYAGFGEIRIEKSSGSEASKEKQAARKHEEVVEYVNRRIVSRRTVMRPRRRIKKTA